MSESLSLASHSPQGVEASSKDPKDSGPPPRFNRGDEAEDSSQDAKGKSKSSHWLPILTALITMIGTLGVSFISIVPQIKSGHAEEMKTLQQELNHLRTKPAPAEPSVSPDKKLSISGTVTKEGGGLPLSGVDVFLLPDGNNLATQTDDSGKFSLRGVPTGTYSIIIRDSSQGRSGKIRLDESENKAAVKMMGARIDYNIR